MNKVEVIISESGKPLLYAADGFIIYGSITTPTGGGMYGGSNEIDAYLQTIGEGKAYTVDEFLDGLYIDPYKLKEYAEAKIKKQSGIR